MSNHTDHPLFDFGHFNINIPSGIHIGVPLDSITRVIPLPKPDSESLWKPNSTSVSLCNPMARSPIPVKQVDEIPASDSATFLRDRPKSKLVRLQDVTDYGEMLSDVAKWLQICGYHGVIVPLRGGLKPWTQLDVLTEMRFPACWLPFTQGANGINREEIRFFLTKFLERYEGTSPLRLAVVDTADSGDSAKSLAEILKSIRVDCRDGSVWATDFILFFESREGKKRCPPKCVSIPKMTTDKIVFRVFACATASLIAEDWDEALGIKTVWRDGKTPEVLVIPSKGRLIIQEYDGTLREYEADRIDQFTDQILGREVSDAVVTDQSLTFARDVWQKYTTKAQMPHVESGNGEGSELPE